MEDIKSFAINNILRAFKNVINAILQNELYIRRMSNSTSNEREAVLTFEDKKYDLNNLPKEVQELVKGMQVADAQLRMHEDTLKVLAVGRQHLAMQLKAKLETINPIN